MTEPLAEPRNIKEALLALQRMNLTVKKTAEGALRAGKTDKYADLGEFNRVVLTALNDMGVIWTCLPTLKGENFVLAYSLEHVPSSTVLEGDFPIPKGEPQKMGSAITYGRRYALGAVTGVTAEGDDDDGQGYGGRQGMAQRANVRQDRTAPATAQRGTPPAPRAERAQPAQRPAVPAPTSPAPVGDGPVRGRGGLITEPMTRKLAITMKEVIGENGADRKQFVVDMIGREVASTKDLTFDEGRAMIDAFEKAKATDNPLLNVIDIYKRTTGPDAAPAPAKRARPAAAPRPSVAEQTRNAVLGTPASEDDRAPWDDEPQIGTEGEWPETVQPGGVA
jgi:hypothetical protein